MDIAHLHQRQPCFAPVARQAQLGEALAVVLKRDRMLLHALVHVAYVDVGEREAFAKVLPAREVLGAAERIQRLPMVAELGPRLSQQVEGLVPLHGIGGPPGAKQPLRVPCAPGVTPLVVRMAGRLEQRAAGATAGGLEAAQAPVAGMPTKNNISMCRTHDRTGPTGRLVSSQSDEARAVTEIHAQEPVRGGAVHVLRLSPGGRPPQEDNGPLGAMGPQRAVGSARRDSSSRHCRSLRVNGRGIAPNGPGRDTPIRGRRPGGAAGGRVSRPAPLTDRQAGRIPGVTDGASTCTRYMRDSRTSAAPSSARTHR